MKTTNRAWRSLGIACMGSSLLFAACSKSNTNQSTGTIPAQNQTTVSAEMQANASFDDVFLNVIGVDKSVAVGGTGVFSANRQSSANQREGTCYAVSWNFVNQNDSFPVNITVDFGSGCTGWDGRVRKGKINTVYSKPLWINGATATSTFTDYSVNDVKVEGTHTLTNLSTNSQLIFGVAINEGKLTGTDGSSITWTVTRTFTQKEGWNTLFDATDDLYTIVSQGNGSISKNGTVYNWSGYNIVPLEKRATCQWISKGIQAIEGSTGAQATLDFGNGDCDNKASITVNGASVEISLR